jgi:alpha-L-fucosidase
MCPGPGETVALVGWQTKVKSARLHASGRDVTFVQERFRVRYAGLPTADSDHPVTTLAIECEGEPVQDTLMVRKERPRDGV